MADSWGSDCKWRKKNFSSVVSTVGRSARCKCRSRFLSWLVPGKDQQIRQALSKWVIEDLIQRAATQKIKPIIYVSIDDSLTSKDKDTSALEGVDWYHDHHASTKKKSIDQKVAVHLSCRVQIEEYSYTFAWRMYLRAKTVRRLNRKRPLNQKLKFKSKYRLAREMLVELKPLIPQGCLVYVLFDSWYASAKLLKFIRRLGKGLSDFHFPSRTTLSGSWTR